MNELPEETRRSARRLRFVTLAAIVLLGAAFLAAAAVMVLGSSAIPVMVIHDSGLAAWPAAVLLLITGLLIGLALFRLVRLLARVERGAAFGAAGELRGFAFWLMLAVLASLIAPPIAQIAAGGGELRLAIDNDQAVMLLVSALLFLVARLLDSAQALAEEHEQIV